MTNVLEIDGKKTAIIMPSIEVPVLLTATYRDREFDFSRITGQIDDEDSALLLLHFSLRDRKYTKGGLNHILLCTVGYNKKEVVYRGIGISKYNNGVIGPEFYNLGDDLEVLVTESAREAVLTLPKEISRAARTSQLMTVEPELLEHFSLASLN